MSYFANKVKSVFCYILSARQLSPSKTVELRFVVTTERRSVNTALEYKRRRMSKMKPL